MKNVKRQRRYGILTKAQFRVLLVTAVFFWSATGLFAYPAVEGPFNRHTDSAPYLAPPIVYPSVDSTWDLLFYTDVEAICGDNQIVGCAYADGKFFISGGNNGINPNMLYVLDSTGVLLNTLTQPTPTSWGWRDMAYDGTYLYAGDNGDTVYAFDTDGNLLPSLYIPRPSGVAMVRALAYDPITDHFWTGNFGAAIVEFDRDGNVISSGSPAPLTAVYGMAWDEVTPGGPWLWIYDQGGTPLTTFHKYDPIAHDFTGEAYTVPLLPGSIDQRAAGCEITDQWDSRFWTMVALTQGVPHDMLYILEILNKSAPAAPGSFDVANNGPDLIASLSWTNPTNAINGDPLASIDSVLVMRNGQTLTGMTGLPGQPMTCDDPVSETGMYRYAVYCTNSFGCGLSAQDSAWIGLDVPGAVTSLTGTGVGTQLIAELTWVNPTTGQHGGYWPPGSIDGYTITRFGPNGATFDLIGLATSITDTNILVQGWYRYRVSPYNASGSGPETFTDPFYVGPPELSSIPFEWFEISGLGTDTEITGDDQNLGPFPIGFDFPFYGIALNQIRICSNGFLAFTSTSTAYNNTEIPSEAQPNFAIYPLWDDLYPPGGGTIWYYNDTINQRFIVEWDDVLTYASPRTPQKFQLILYPSGDIDVMYHTVQAPCTNSNTVGKENGDGSAAVQATFNGSGPLEPESNTGIRIYGPPEPVPDVSVTLTPEILPIQIPASGGNFDYNIAIVNNADSTVQADVWCNVTLPGGSTFGPVLGPVNLQLTAGFIGNRYRTQAVPGSAPAGNYIYYGYLGVYPDIIWDLDSFPFEKLSSGEGSMVKEWKNSGESFEDWFTTEPESIIPDHYTLYQNYPNPFNPSTTLTIALPEAAKVTLAVYDIMGRQIVELVNGWRDAGIHEVTFDGSDLASGVYVYRLETGEFVSCGKLVLMK